MTDRQFILDENEETKEKFWHKVTFNKPTGDGVQQHTVRCEFELLDSGEIDDLTLDDNGEAARDGNAALLRRVWTNAAGIMTRDNEGKMVEADFSPQLKEAMLKRPYFVTAAAIQYTRAVMGVDGGSTTKRKRGN